MPTRATRLRRGASGPGRRRFACAGTACDHLGRVTDNGPSIQCSTGPFWAFELERALDAIADAGFKEVELMVTRDPRTHEPETPLRLAEERGLRIGAVHGPFLVITKTVWGLDPIHKVKRGAEMCKEVGAPTLIVHPPYLWERDYARWLAKDAEAFTLSTGITVAVETMYPKWIAGRKLRAYRWLDAGVLCDNCNQVALDTSHLTVARQDILTALDRMRAKLAHVHLSDNAGDGRDGHLELEQGILPLDRFLAELRRTRYTNAISLEISVIRYLEKQKALVETLRKNREYVESHLVGKPRSGKGMPRP
jgi:sugar phosphate isomerase/epimerase